MVSLLSTILVLALSRAEIIERMRAPVVTQADGLVKVFADCPEYMRREYQMPVARFADETVGKLYEATARRPEHFLKPGIVIHIGDRTNRLTEVVARVSTNDSEVVTRIWLKSPGYADLGQFRLAVVKGFFRSVEKREVSDDEAERAFRLTDPRERVVDERRQLEDWLSGHGNVTNDELGLKLMRRVFEPGKASQRDVLIFASRLYLYPPQRDVRLALKYECLSFRDAVKFASWDPLTRAVAFLKANDLLIAGGGRGAELEAAARSYREFLLAFARGKDDTQRLLDLLEEADGKLNVAYEKGLLHTRELNGGSGDVL